MDSNPNIPSPADLRAHRLELGASYVQLGELFNVHWSTVRQWEFGRSFPNSAARLRRLARFVKGEFDAFFSQGVHLPRPHVIDSPLPEKLLSPSIKFDTSAHRKRNRILTDAQFLTELESLNQSYLKKYFSLKDGGYF